MRHTRPVTTLLLTLLVSVASAQQPRRVPMTTQRPLATNLRPGDRSVVIESVQQRRHRLPPLPGQSYARFLVVNSDVAAVIRVDTVRSFAARLMESPPDAPLYRWWHVPASEDDANRIVSTVSARVETLFKGSPKITEGERFAFDEEYGSATIRGVTVEYKTPWLRPLVPGRRYVLFGNFLQDGRFLKFTAYEERLPGVLLERTFLDQDERPNDQFEQLTLLDAVAHINREMVRK